MARTSDGGGVNVGGPRAAPRPPPRPQPAARADSNEEQPAPRLKRAGHQGDGPGDLPPDATHGDGAPAVLAVHQRHDLDGSERVEPAAAGVGLFGRKRAVAGTKHNAFDHTTVPC